MVSDTLGIGGEFQILRPDGRCTDAFLHTGDVPVFHFFGVVVDFLLYEVGFAQGLQAFILIRIHRMGIQLVQQFLQLADFIFGIVGELLGSVGKDGSIFNDVLRIIANPFEVSDTAVSAV